MAFYSHYVVVDNNSTDDNPKAYIIDNKSRTHELWNTTYTLKYCRSEEEAQDFCDKYNAFSEPTRYYLFEDFDKEDRAGFIAVGIDEATRILAVSSAYDCLRELVGYNYEEALDFCERYNDGEEFPDFQKEGTYVLEIYSENGYDNYEDEIDYKLISEEYFFTYEEALEAATDYEDYEPYDYEDYKTVKAKITRNGTEVYGNSDQYAAYPTRIQAEQALYGSDKHFKVDDMDKEIARIKQEMAQSHKNSREYTKG